MSVTINSLPRAYMGKRNPMLVEVETDAYVTDAGTVLVGNLVDNVPRTAGQTVTLSMDGNEVVITFSATPDYEKYEVRPYTGILDIPDTIADLQKLPLIDRYYVVSGTYSAGAGHIDFTQRVPSSTEGVLDVVSWPSSTWATTVASSFDPEYAPNFRLVVAVYAQDEQHEDRKHVLLGSRDCIPDKTSQVGKVELQTVFDSLLVGEAPQTTTNMGPDRCRAVSIHYWLEVYEKYGDTPVNKTPVMAGKKEDYLVATRGGMPWAEWDKDAYMESFYTDTPNRYMTSAGPKITREDMPQWLLWWNNVHNAGAKLKVVATFSNATTDDFYSQTGTLDVGIYRYATGYAQLNVAGNVTIPTGHRVVSYTVQVVDSATGTTALSEAMTYTIDTMAGPSRYLVYENMLGGLDTLHCAGAENYGMDARAVEAMGVADPEYLKYDGPARQYKAVGADVLTWNTGWMNPAQLEKLRELALADNVWVVNGSDLLRVVLDRSAFADLYGMVVPPEGIALPMRMANLR